MIRKELVELVLPYIPATVNFHVQPPRTENLFTYPATPTPKKKRVEVWSTDITVLREEHNSDPT